MSFDTPPITPDGSQPPCGPEVSPPEPTGNPMLEAALGYHARGFNPIPQNRDKKPLVKWKQFQKRHATEEEIQAGWSRNPGANIAIVTGAISDVVVVDIDGPEGVAALQEFSEMGDVSPPVVETGRGFHAYFKHPGGKVKTVRIRPGLDIKGDGGLVTAPPSVHKSGAVYRFKAGLSLDDVSIPELPPSLLAALRDEGQKTSTNGSTPAAGANGSTPALDRYTQGALDQEIGRLTAADDGTRNDVLNKAAFSLGQLVGADALPRELAERQLFQAATRCGLTEEDATRATIKSGLDAGVEQPRDLSHVKSGQAGHAALGWGSREDLPPALPPAPVLPKELVPEPLRLWLADMAERASIPLEFIAMPAICGLGTLLGRKVCIRPKRKDDWLVVANLWGMIIARPSTKKSAAIKSAMKPINQIVDDAQKEFDKATQDAEGRKVVLNTKLKGLKVRATKLASKGVIEEQAEIDALNKQIIGVVREMESLIVTEKRFVTNDTTIEKLGELLNQNPNGLMVLRDELSGLIRTLAKPDKAGDREFYLECWDGTGKNFTTDRIGRGTIRIKSPTVSLFGGIQPSKLKALINSAVDGGVGDDGFLQRFQLTVWPDQLGDYKRCDRDPDREAEVRAFAIFKAFRDLTPTDVGATLNFGDGFAFLLFATDAQDFVDEWFDNLEWRLRSDELEDYPAFESHLAKYRSLLPALALIFHIIDVVDGGERGPVSLEAAQMAAKWCEFLEAHARKVYAAELSRGLSAAHLLAAKIKDGAILDGMRVRDIYHAHWQGLKSSESVWIGLRELESLGWVQIMTVRATGGAPAHMVQLHPELLKNEK